MVDRRRDDPETKDERLAELLEVFRTTREHAVKRLEALDVALQETRALVERVEREALNARPMFSLAPPTGRGRRKRS